MQRGPSLRSSPIRTLTLLFFTVLAAVNVPSDDAGEAIAGSACLCVIAGIWVYWLVAAKRSA